MQQKIASQRPGYARRSFLLHNRFYKTFVSATFLLDANNILLPILRCIKYVRLAVSRNIVCFQNPTFTANVHQPDTRCTAEMLIQHYSERRDPFWWHNRHDWSATTRNVDALFFVSLNAHNCASFVYR